MSEEKQSQETEGKINDAESVEETTPQPERGIEEEIEALAAEAEGRRVTNRRSSSVRN